MQEFTANEWLRYTRHIQLDKFGLDKQRSLKAAKVLIIGAGGLGCPVSSYLAAAGVGSITLVDGDCVDLTNLQRQVLFTTDDIGTKKALAAAARLQSLNPDINIQATSDHLNLSNARDLISANDLIIDCTDNFAARYLINDVCRLESKPWIYASIHKFSGQCAVFTPDGPCFRCLFAETPQDTADCNSAGVLGVLPGLLGMHQANEAIKHLCDLPGQLKNTLFLFDALELTQQKIKLSKRGDCEACSKQISLEDLEKFYEFKCESDSIHADEISTQGLALKLELGKKAYLCLIDVRESDEHKAFNIGGINTPLSKLNDENTLSKLSQNTENDLIVYCQSGARSKKAVETLKAQNIVAKSLRGGILEFLRNQKLS